MHKDKQVLSILRAPLADVILPSMKDPIISFKNSYVNLPERFYSPAQAEPAPDPQLICYNGKLADHLGLNFSAMSEADLAVFFSGTNIPKGAEPIALAYAGHQFGHFVPQLGDGRALLLGEVIDKNGERNDIQLKGSGPTSFSRGGDGRSPLGPVLREYILSEAMYHLGIPTTRALAAITTGSTVYRETPLPGAIFTRVALSHIRVGSFEYFAARNDLEALRSLLEYTATRHFPEIEHSQNLAIDFFRQVLSGQAQLIARWMDVGFIHGVMNTDNTSIAGITIDFGPCAFMDEYKSDKVFSSIDRHGRYAYKNQPLIAQWNLARLASALIPLAENKESIIQLFETELEQFKLVYENNWLNRFCKKLGIKIPETGDLELVNLWLTYLENKKLDYTLGFRELAEQLINDNVTEKKHDNTEYREFIQKWKNRLSRQSIDPTQVATSMNTRNPIYIPRNHLIERAISESYEGDYSFFRELIDTLANPFEPQKDRGLFQNPPSANELVQQTFCGT